MNVDNSSPGEVGIEKPGLSVIIPVRNDPHNLETCLAALDASRVDFAHEIIVVDDASTDHTPEVAGRHGVRLIRQQERSGPAAARNRGARLALHPYLFFLDADVAVRTDTLARVVERFASSPPIDAFFGSYDASPGAPGLVSEYRNLLHHFVHQSGNKDAFSFWSGCGAIKRSVFVELGGFDVGYSNASIEDIELGSRLRRSGHRIELLKDLQVKHLKRWTLWQMVRTDVEKRGVPWTRLLLRQGKMPNDLNLRHSQRWSVALTAALTLALGAAVWRHEELPFWLTMALACLLGITFLNLKFFEFLSRVRRPLFALQAVPLHVLYYFSSGVAFCVGVGLHLVGRRGPGGPGPSR